MTRPNSASRASLAMPFGPARMPGAAPTNPASIANATSRSHHSGPTGGQDQPGQRAETPVVEARVAPKIRGIGRDQPAETRPRRHEPFRRDELGHRQTQETAASVCGNAGIGVGAPETRWNVPPDRRVEPLDQRDDPPAT